MIFFRRDVLRIVCAGLLCFFITGEVAAAGKNSVREVQLREVMRITDESGDFAFNQPREIQCDESGDIYVRGKNQLLRFDSQGHFKGNLLKLGEGPGEVKYIGGFGFDGSKMLIAGMGPVKIISLNTARRFEHEIKLVTLKPYSPYLFSHDGRYFFSENNINFSTLKTGINKRVHTLVMADRQGKVERTDLEFDTLDALIKKTSKEGTIVMMNEITRLLKTFDGGKFLYVSHKARYGIDQVDLTTMKVVNRFTREYTPIEYQPQKLKDPEDNEIERIADQKFFNDIQSLRCLGTDLLVLTSRIDPKRGVQVDRFNSNGTLLYSFYLKIPGVNRPEDLQRKALYFSGEHFWTSFLDDDDNPVVVKYLLDWNAL